MVAVRVGMWMWGAVLAVAVVGFAGAAQAQIEAAAAQGGSGESGVSLAVPELSLEAAGAQLREATWKTALATGSLGAVDVVLGGVLMARSDPGNWNSFSGVVEGSSVASARRWGLGLGTLSVGIGNLVGTVVALSTLPRYRKPARVVARLRHLRFWDRPWLKALVTGFVLATFVGLGAATYAVAEDPTMQGFGLAMLGQTLGVAITVPVGQWLQHRVHPYYPLADAPVP